MNRVCRYRFHRIVIVPHRKRISNQSDSVESVFINIEVYGIHYFLECYSGNRPPKIIERVRMIPDDSFIGFLERGSPIRRANIINAIRLVHRQIDNRQIEAIIKDLKRHKRIRHVKFQKSG